MLNNTTALSLIMLAAGIGIPIMASISSGLGVRLGNPTFAVLILFVMTVPMAAVLSAGTTFPSREVLFEVPFFFYLGAFFVVFYVFSVTWITPRIGVGNAVFLVLFGQILAAAIIDHFGLFGAQKWSITPARLLGLVLMVLGVFLAKRPA